MDAVNLIPEHVEGENPPAIWTGYLSLPGVGAVVVVDGAPYEVVSHRYEVNQGAVWQTPIQVIVRPIGT